MDSVERGDALGQLLGSVAGKTNDGQNDLLIIQTLI